MSLKGKEHWKAKLDDYGVARVRYLRDIKHLTWGELRKRFDMSSSGLQKAYKGTNWRAVPTVVATYVPPVRPSARELMVMRRVQGEKNKNASRQREATVQAGRR